MALSEKLENRVNQIEEILNGMDDISDEEAMMLYIKISTVRDLNFIRKNRKVG